MMPAEEAKRFYLRLFSELPTRRVFSKEGVLGNPHSPGPIGLGS
jgi:hypothetical protein